MPEDGRGAQQGDSNGFEDDVDAITHHSRSPPLPVLCAQIHARLEAFLSAESADEKVRAVQRQSRESLGVIGRALERYRLDELSLSYNGGKDCLVLLILYLSALHAHYNPPSTSANHASTTTNSHHPPQLPATLESVYILSKHPFKAVDDFVASSVTRYHLSLSRYAKPMKEAFTDYLLEHPHVKAIFVGTRRTDPHGASLAFFDPTDRGWPPFMRIHPVIDWHYAEIWTFIRALGVPYCSLYDLGYTSLGGTMDTFPNPALKCAVGEGEEDAGRFRPAYELLEDERERLGRDRSGSGASAGSRSPERLRVTKSP